MILSLLGFVYSADFIPEIRVHLSSLPLLKLRERLLLLMAVITDLALVPSHYLQSGTPTLSLLNLAVLDILFGGSSSRPRQFTPS